MLIHHQNLLPSHIGDGIDGGDDGVAHIALYRFAGDDIAGHLHHLGQLVDQRDALGLGGHQYLGFLGQLCGQRTGAGLHHIGIAENDKAGDRHILIDGDNGQAAVDAGHCNVVIFLHGNAPFFRILGKMPLDPFIISQFCHNGYSFFYFYP